MVDSSLKDHPSFLFKPMVLIGIRMGGLCVLFSYLARFWHVQTLPVHSSFYLLEPSLKNLPLHHLGQWGDSLALLDSLW